MPAFDRRRTFAAPVILIAACSSKEPPKPQRFPGVTWSVQMADMKCTARELGPNPTPPRSIACPPGMSATTTFTVGELPDKQCGIVPAGCYDARCVKIRTACPLPPGELAKHGLAVVWIVEKRGDKCHAEEGEHDCPPGVDCNPPEPRYVPCPPGISEETPVRIAELPNATCAIAPADCDDSGCLGAPIACPTM